MHECTVKLVPMNRFAPTLKYKFKTRAEANTWVSRMVYWSKEVATEYVIWFV